MTTLEAILIVVAVGSAGAYLLWHWLRPQRRPGGCGSNVCHCTVSRPGKLPSKAATSDSKS